MKDEVFFYNPLKAEHQKRIDTWKAIRFEYMDSLTFEECRTLYAKELIRQGIELTPRLRLIYEKNL